MALGFFIVCTAAAFCSWQEPAGSGNREQVLRTWCKIQTQPNDFPPLSPRPPEVPRFLLPLTLPAQAADLLGLVATLSTAARLNRGELILLCGRYSLSTCRVHRPGQGGHTPPCVEPPTRRG